MVVSFGGSVHLLQGQRVQGCLGGDVDDQGGFFDGLVPLGEDLPEGGREHSLGVDVDPGHLVHSGQGLVLEAVHLHEPHVVHQH